VAVALRLTSLATIVAIALFVTISFLSAATFVYVSDRYNSSAPLQLVRAIDDINFRVHHSGIVRRQQTRNLQILRCAIAHRSSMLCIVPE